MKIKSLIIEDESGKQYSFTHRSVVEDKTYDPSKDPEVQGISLADLAQTSTKEEVEKLVTKTKSKKKK